MLEGGQGCKIVWNLAAAKPVYLWCMLGLEVHERDTVRQEKMFACHPADPSPHLTTTSSAMPTIPHWYVSNQQGREADKIAHALTSICAITPFDTWFHVTRWPAGWTTKTRNKGSRYKWSPSGHSFHSVKDGEKMEVEDRRGSTGLHFCTHTQFGDNPAEVATESQ